MKKRTPLIIVSLVAAFTLLAVTAFASAPTYEGYEAFKELAKNHEDQDFQHENGTMTGTFTVIDNDKVLLSVDAVLKADGNKENGSGIFTVSANGETKTLNVYGQDKMAYIFDEAEGNYYVADKKQMEKYHENEWEDYEDDADFRHGRGMNNSDHEMSPAQEELFDFIVGDLKDDFALINNNDGSETITFELTKEEMPMLLNLFVSAADGKNHRDFEDEEVEPSDELIAKYPILGDLVDMKVDVPEITDNIELDYVKMAITTEADGIFSDVLFNVVATGDDETGISHTIEIIGEFTLSEVGTTVMDTANLEGKTLIEINPEDFEEFRNNDANSFKGRR